MKNIREGNLTMSRKFRLLRADEIDCRVAQIKENGLSLLLYKDARCDMNILDETVGEFNWKREHCRDNANCIVSIWDAEKGQWISKEDTGTESQSEAEKGLASDSFKRACFNWGVGRELYTAPFMWVPADKCNITPKESGFTCYDRFRVDEIKYKDRAISYVRISNLNTKAVIEYGNPITTTGKIGTVKAKALAGLLDEKNVAHELIYSQYHVNSLEDLTEEQHASIVRRLEKTK